VSDVTTPSGIVIAFDEEKHKYMVDGERFPSVTTLLGIVDKSGPLMAWAVAETEAGRNYRETRDTAATRGTSVHDALEVLAREGTPPSLTDFPEEDRGYVSGLCSWWLDHEPKAVLVEQVVASKRLRFAGKFDLLAVIDGTRVLLDLKTSKRVYETHHLQTAAYMLALEECRYVPADEGWILRVAEDGSFEFVRSNAGPEDFEAVAVLYETLKKVRRKPKQVAA